MASAPTPTDPASAALQAKYAALDPYANAAIADINSGNYAAALQEGIDSGKLYNTNYGATTTDPLLQDLETSSGLKALDPSYNWTADDAQKYYQALSNNSTFRGTSGESLGKNPYGVWGSGNAVASGADAAANIAQEGTTPDIARFAGARPSSSFMQKWGVPIATIAAAALAPEAIGALAPMLGGGMLGAAGAGALYGAGTGAVEGAIGHGNIGKDALIGGIGGGITGGLNAPGGWGAQATNALSPTLGAVGSNALVKGVEGAGVGALTGEIANGGTGARNGALAGGIGGGLGGAFSGAADASGAGPAGSAAAGAAGAIMGSRIASPMMKPLPAKAGPAPVNPVIPGTTASALPTLPGSGDTSTPPSTAGLGYAPRQEADMSGTNWATYGQGPEQQFFKPAGT